MTQTPGVTPLAARREQGWAHFAGDEVADVLVTALAVGGVEHLFFTSGSDILFFQEAVAKAQATGRPTPDIVTTMHETIAMNAALGNTMVTGRPAATAVHVDVGTLNYGCALHTAFAGSYPVFMISGSPAKAYPGTHKGGRDHPIYWIQERYDQRELARSYAKWLYRLELHDNPGLVVSRGLQLALSAPQAPVFLTVPREVAMSSVDGSSFPTVEQLGIVRPSGPDPDAIDELAGWLLAAVRPVIITGRGGRDPESVAELVRVAEIVGASVTDNGFRDRLNFPSTHPLLETGAAPSEADVVLVVDRKVPWVPAGERPDEGALPDDRSDLGLADPARAPRAGCRIAWIAEDPAIAELPLLELAGDLRIASAPRLALRALGDALEDRVDAPGRERAADRLRTARVRKKELRARYERDARAAANRKPIDPRWLSYQLGRIVDKEAIVLDEALSNAPFVRRYVDTDRPGSFFAQGGSGGGWGSGAAIGAKLAEPERDVILASGDGFYAFGLPTIALWTAVRYGLPYLAVVYVNARYTTGTSQVVDFYGDDGYAAAAGFPGGRFDPPPDFAAEARATGAHGESVDDPQDIEGALSRALAATRDGQPAVVAVRIP
jgi:acetolactate synthase I/II/III large subunit